MHRTARADRLRRACTRVADQRGFTLVEMLISMILLTIILTSLTSVLVSVSHDEIDTNLAFPGTAEGSHRARRAPPRDPLRQCRHPADRGPDLLDPRRALQRDHRDARGRLPHGDRRIDDLRDVVHRAQRAGQRGLHPLPRELDDAAAGDLCLGGQVRWIDYLQTSTPFRLPNSSVACASICPPALGASCGQRSRAGDEPAHAARLTADQSERADVGEGLVQPRGRRRAAERHTIVMALRRIARNRGEDGFMLIELMLALRRPHRGDPRARGRLRQRLCRVAPGDAGLEPPRCSPTRRWSASAPSSTPTSG